MKARLLAAALLAGVGLAVWRDLQSPVSRSLRAREPVTALLSLRFEGQGSVVPPTLYLAVYGRAAGSLELVRILPDTELSQAPGEHKVRTLADAYGAAFIPEGAVRSAEDAMAGEAAALLTADPMWPKTPRGPVPPAFRLAFELPGRARPAFSGELKRELAERLRKPMFWIDLVKSGRREPSSSARISPTYDLFLIARQLRSLAAEDVHISRLPVSDLIRPFLGGVFRRASGLPEPAAPKTIEVLNATEQSGVALRATKILRLAEFDVVHFGNARLRRGAAPPEHTRFLDRTGRVGGALAAARALGCRDPEMLTILERQPPASVSVVIGRDFERCDGLNMEIAWNW